MEQRPTLYIEATDTNFPYAPMQDEYHSIKESLTEQDPKKTKLEEGPENPLLGETIDKKTPQTFNEMTTEQKLDYLIPTSKQLPAIHCKLTINKSYYRGKILAREEENFVFEERQTRKRHLFNVSEITDLRLIGF